MKRTHRIKMTLKRQLGRAAWLGPMVFVLVAGAGCPSFFQSETQRATRIRLAIEGRDGPRTITAANTVVNAYAALAGADRAVGNTTITVDNIANLGTGFTAALSRGDLLLIVQMQGATIDVTESTAYGTVTALGSAGNYEFVGVEGVAGNVITLACGLKNAYTVAGRTQVVRVPQYTTLTVNSGASITANAWNGTTGGVVAVHAQTTLQLSGSIDATGAGFRGGSIVGDNLSRAEGTATTLYRSAAPADGGEKGEGIAGYQASYTNGRYGRGAPANGGGGGNSHNAGGGGGANAPSGTATWTGQGVMITNDPVNVVGGALAWPLDPNYAQSPSPGGGRGGYTFSANNLDATTAAGAPGLAGWGGNNRRQVGGLGGHTLTNSPAARLFIGGGGGAGDGNNGAAGPGGAGGGLVFVIAGSVTGTGSILASGQAGSNSSPAAGNSGDAAGGGGGGGTIVVHAGSLTAITISANGGVGGNQTMSSGPNEAEGPGGGGGGGYIAISGTGNPTLSAGRGLGGTTNRAGLAEFPSNGATAGNTGVTNGDATSFNYCGTTADPDTIIVTSPANPSASATADFTFQATLGGIDASVDITSSVTFECRLDDGSWATCEESYTLTNLTEGSHTLRVRATDLSGNTDPDPATYTWTVAFPRFDAAPPDAAPVAPDTVIVSGPTRPISTNPSSTFIVQATLSSPGIDGTTDVTDTSTFQCRLTKNSQVGSWFACNTNGLGYSTGPLEDADYILEVRATNGGVTDPSPATWTWTIQAEKRDAAPVDTALPWWPLTVITSRPDSDPWPDLYTTFTFEALTSPGGSVIPDATFECELFALNTSTGQYVLMGPWVDCEAPYTVGPLGDGAYQIYVRATANGVTDQTPAFENWTVRFVALDGGSSDAPPIPPDTLIVTHPDKTSGSDTARFTFAAIGPDGRVVPDAAFECRLDEGTQEGGWAACSSGDPIGPLQDGGYTFWVRATDPVAGPDPTPAKYEWTVQAGASTLDAAVLDAAPEDGPPVSITTSIDQHPTDPSVNPTGTFTFDATARVPGSDGSVLIPGVTFECKLDNGDWETCDSPYTTPSLTDGSHTLTVRAVDADGNKDPTGASFTWTVQTVKPDASSGRDTRDAQKSDVALPSPDTAPGTIKTELLGAGFCTLAPSRTTSPAAFFGLALITLAVLLRRRRR